MTDSSILAWIPWTEPMGLKEQTEPLALSLSFMYLAALRS